jgi:hypothetical protein
LGNKTSIVSNDETPIQFSDKSPFLTFTIENLLKRFPRNLFEIQRRAMLNIYRKYNKYGEYIKSFECFQFFAQDKIALGYIIKSLTDKGFLSGKVLERSDGICTYQMPFKISPEGWNEIEKSLHNLSSKQVFIAMSFDTSMEPVRDIIKKTIDECGLTPIIMNEVEHINCIPMEIQAKIKNSGLMIVDLTTQNKGAYFEAGYAMALNIPVIWCCNKNDERNLHFDIKQYIVSG